MKVPAYLFALKFDYFHELIIAQELSRIHARGYSDGLGGGTCIGLFTSVLGCLPNISIFPGLPPILNFGNPTLREQIAMEVLSGKKFTCLAVTEAFAGSDVAGLKCRAKKVEGGWVVNGT